jgi:RNA polymerase sigma-70 factor (ECF subfamily)
MTMAVGVNVAEVGEREKQIVALCRAGDLDAFGQVYARYGDTIFRHAFYLLGHHEDADDIKQETFLRAYRALPAFRHESSLRTWLLKICTNLCYDRLKRRQRQPEISYEPQQAQQYLAETLGDRNGCADPQSALDRADTLQTLLRVLRAMPLPQRSLIVLHVLEGLDYKEIGHILGCAPLTAKMRVLRATRQFKERAVSLMNASL